MVHSYTVGGKPPLAETSSLMFTWRDLASHAGQQPSSGIQSISRIPTNTSCRKGVVLARVYRGRRALSTPLLTQGICQSVGVDRIACPRLESQKEPGHTP